MQPAVKPQPVEPFLKAIARSGLLSDEQIQKAYQAAPTSIRKQPELLADYFVRTGVLSQFQSQKLLQGVEKGLVLGPYHVLAPIGRGGMGGTVFLARDARDQRLLALKVLPPQKYREEERVLTRFRREMELCQKVSHPHLARAFESNVYHNIYFIAMEFIPGKSLSQKVAGDGLLPVHRTARIFAQVCSALQYAHQQGLIHRDLKPSNIMITPNGHAKVLDLGLALMEGEDLPADKSILGGQGYIVGTMDYIAPEQVADPTGVDLRADLYSLGCSLYFALTGQPPFPGGTSQQKMKRHLNEWPTPVTEVNPTVPARFAVLIEHLMSKQPDQRPRSAELVRKQLQAWVGDEPVLPMDTAADNAHPREVFDLETDQMQEGSFWESMPGTIFVPAQVDSSAPRREFKPSKKEANKGMSSRTLMILACVAGGILVALLLALVIVAMIMLKR
ncbi:MAG TPA: serine/threonine-protein kinase [Gemmataceae bacterium]|jgi:serine/threonine protein kinase|nr:serine/threonine-protein kinase [Gemmataceae bacterium]